MTHVTHRLTAKNRDQLRKPSLGSRLWAIVVWWLLMQCDVDACHQLRMLSWCVVPRLEVYCRARVSSSELCAGRRCTPALETARRWTLWAGLWGGTDGKPHWQTPLCTLHRQVSQRYDDLTVCDFLLVSQRSALFCFFVCDLTHPRLCVHLLVCSYTRNVGAVFK